MEAFALKGDLDVQAIPSCTFEIEWPPKSGRRRAFPEVDRLPDWFRWWSCLEGPAGQRPLLDRLEAMLGAISCNNLAWLLG